MINLLKFVLFCIKLMFLSVVLLAIWGILFVVNTVAYPDYAFPVVVLIILAVCFFIFFIEFDYQEIGASGRW